MSIRVGEKAPDFRLEGVINGEFKTVSLADFKGKWLVLYFYPLDFTFVCPTEVNDFSDRLEEFKSRGAEVLAASTDSKFSHRAWLETPRKRGGIQGCKYPILADFTKSVAASYDVLQEGSGVAVRGLFVIDPDGIVQAIQVNNLPVGRNADEVLRLLDAFQENKKNGSVCPVGWKKGEESIVPSKAKEWFEKNA